MTTENLAVLFSDVVGSTELSLAMPPEAADEVRRGYFSVLRQAVAATGGHEVKGLGDGIMAIFASASAALACSVAMQQGVEHDNRDRAYSVGLRVGLSGGEVTADDDGDYYGDSVIEAARLCAVCEGGQILSAAVVPMMAGRRNRHVCRSVGVMTLKGLPDPVDTVEVMWEPLVTAEAGGAIPLQPRLTVRPTVGLVGRELETAALASAFTRVASGEGREILLVSGEAGLGKTTLVAEAARAAHRTGASVLFGHCEEDMTSPYQLFAESLGHYVTNVDEERLTRHTRPMALSSRGSFRPSAAGLPTFCRPEELTATPSGICSSPPSSSSWQRHPPMIPSCSSSMTSSGPTPAVSSSCATWRQQSCRCECWFSRPFATTKRPTRRSCATPWDTCGDIAASLGWNSKA